MIGYGVMYMGVILCSNDGSVVQPHRRIGRSSLQVIRHLPKELQHGRRVVEVDGCRGHVYHDLVLTWVSEIDLSVSIPFHVEVIFL